MTSPSRGPSAEAARPRQGLPSSGPRDAHFDRWRHAFAAFTAASTLVLIFAGGLVTSTGSGLSVPDWPLSYGMVMPPMVGGVRFEHGHRLVASFVGLLTLALALWTARADARRGVRRLAWLALLAVVVQGVLGGLTVLFLLPLPVSVTHACLAQVFLCLTVALAYATSREWLEAGEGVAAAGPVAAAGRLAIAAVFVQLLLGALMRHLGAGLAIPTFPLAFGRLVPPLHTLPVAVHFAHRAFALLVAAAVIHLAWRARNSADARFARMGAGLVLLVALQVGLGGWTVLAGKAVTPTTLHVATGAAVLGGCVLLTLRAHRLGRSETAVPAEPALAVAPPGLKAWS